MKQGRVAIPGKIINMLYADDEFYREVISSKKISIQNFPKHDQWSDDDGFHMEFALAGYCPSDVSISIIGNVITVNGTKEANDSIKNMQTSNTNEGNNEDVDITPLIKISKGMIVRGIARRKFMIDFFISHYYDVNNISASMTDGLLKITVPHVEDLEPKQISIMEG